MYSLNLKRAMCTQKSANCAKLYNIGENSVIICYNIIHIYIIYIVGMIKRREEGFGAEMGKFYMIEERYVKTC